MRVGLGYDVHRLTENRDLIIGGVKIPYEKGLLGHSDADVLLHAISDALLGAASLGDIGKHFPDTDEKYKSGSFVSRSFFILFVRCNCEINAPCPLLSKRGCRQGGALLLVGIHPRAHTRVCVYITPSELMFSCLLLVALREIKQITTNQPEYSIRII